MPPRKKPAKKADPDPQPEAVVEAALEVDGDEIRRLAASLVKEAIEAHRQALRSGSPDRRDKVASTYAGLVVREVVKEGTDESAAMEEFHRLRRESGLSGLIEPRGER